MKWAMKVIRFFKSRTRLVAWWFLLNQNFVKKYSTLAAICS